METGNKDTASKDPMNVARNVSRGYQAMGESMKETLVVAGDDVSGAEFDPR